ncbi:ATP-binding protein [Thalassotalea fonticola]|uniref:histidine kinase n=1 Tax=Thalassotalea fonticola TaxID=3065649 RepID=A0ABZ0GV76_9GAMM|nr:ATP-binding protein [Colwelliaceae bacterium S1-1]
MTPLLPKRLAGQLILLLLSTLVLSQAFTLLYSLSEPDGILQRIEDNSLLKETAIVANTLAQIPTESHKLIIRTATAYRIEFRLNEQSGIPTTLLANSQGSKVEVLRSLLTRSYEKIYVHQYPKPQNRAISFIKHFVSYLFSLNSPELKEPERQVLLSASILLDSGQWLNMDVFEQKPFPIWARSSLTSLLIVSVIATLIVVISIKRITRPLQELTNKAQQLGVGENVEPMIEQGPEDIKTTISAFNIMQQRLQNIITHRTRSLAAMSHDLRTPLTSLRLHAEFVTDDDTREKIVEKIDEMEHITNATMLFAKQDSWSEQRREVDLSALVDSLCQDLSDIGLAVDFELSDKLNYTCRPNALRRAISNLVENGVKYGSAVFVKIVEGHNNLQVIISDQGPGIAESQQQRLFEPFERLDDSRNYKSGGLGLGMTIALTIIRGHGGDITLLNRASKGLDVVVTLPNQ